MTERQAVSLERYGERNTRIRAKTCPECGRGFRPEKSEQKYCGRQCVKEMQSRTRRGKRVPRGRAHKVDLGPKITPQSVPMCPQCGERLSPSYSFGSDPMTGRSTIYCPHCGEQPLQLYGTRTHDQRQRLVEDMEVKVGRAQRSVVKERHGGHGDAWRQQTHRKGS